MSIGGWVIVVLVLIVVIAASVLGICVWAAERRVKVAPDYADMGVPVLQRRVQLAAPEPPTRTWHCTVLHMVDGRWRRLGVSEFVWPAWSAAEVETELHRRIEARQPGGQYRVDVARAVHNAA